jgi:hypothetical protein
MEQRPAQTSTVCRILVAAKIQDMEGPLARSIKLCPVADSASQQSLLTHDSPDMRSTVHPSPQELQLKRQTVIPHTTRPGTTKPPRCHPEDVHPPRHQQNTFISGWRSSASPHLGVPCPDGALHASVLKMSPAIPPASSQSGHRKQDVLRVPRCMTMSHTDRSVTTSKFTASASFVHCTTAPPRLGSAKQRRGTSTTQSFGSAADAACNCGAAQPLLCGSAVPSHTIDCTDTTNCEVGARSSASTGHDGAPWTAVANHLLLTKESSA